MNENYAYSLLIRRFGKFKTFNFQWEIINHVQLPSPSWTYAGKCEHRQRFELV